MEEIWKPVPGFPGYSVSNLGRVRSEHRTVQFKRRGRFKVCERILKTPPNAQGYPNVCIRDKDRNTKTPRVHVLVLLAFVGPCPEGMECCHLDGDRGNAKLDNLRWDTPKSNMQDRERHGRHDKGSRSVKAKLTEDQIPEIRRKLAQGNRSMCSISKDYRVDVATIRDIRDGWTWKHVK